MDKCVTLSVHIDSPAAGSFVNLANVSSFNVQGACSQIGGTVLLTGGASAPCTSTGWTASLDLTALSDGPIEIVATLDDNEGHSVTDTRVFSKDTVVPNIAITAPAAGSYVSVASSFTLSVSGTCSEDGRAVLLSGDATGSTMCTSGAWSVLLDFSTASAGVVTVLIDHTDAAGNAAPQASSSFVKIDALSLVPLYPGYGNWNDYVRNDGPDVYHATGVPCDGTEAGYDACIHGGELRKLVLAGATSCTGLGLSDALSAFNWICDASSGTTTFYSTGLKSTKGLQDLVTDASWKRNRVTLSLSGTSGGASADEYWWQNPVTSLPDNKASTDVALSLDGIDDGGNDAIYTAGTVFTLSASRASQGYNLNLNRIAVVIFSGQTLSYAGSSTNNCNDTTGEATTPDKVCLLSSGSQNFLWIEGQLSAGVGAVTPGHLLLLASTHHSVVRRTSAQGSASGAGAMALGPSFDSNRVSQVTASNDFGSSGTALLVRSSSQNMFRGVIALSSTNGVLVRLGGANAFHDVIAVGNEIGITLNGAVSNTLSQVRSFNNGDDGLDVISSSNGNTVSGFTGNGNASGCIWITASSDNTITRVTCVNGIDSGVTFWSGSKRNTLNNLVVANGRAGVEFSSGGGSDTTISQIVAAHNDTGLNLQDVSTRTKFSGLLQIGNNTASCVVTGGTNPGLVNGTCANNGASDAVLRIGLSLASSFVGKVTADDTANASDSSGTATYPGTPSSFDWTSFSNVFRSWGRDGSAFPNVDQRGQWSSGAGRIWDWRLHAADTTLLGTTRTGTAGDPPFQAKAPCPQAVSGNIATTDQASPSHTYLLNAAEIVDPLAPGYSTAGNHNGLCESNEACLYTPNFGAYQGEGAVGSCVFDQNGGPVSGVTMYGYSTNGI